MSEADRIVGELNRLILMERALGGLVLAHEGVALGMRGVQRTLEADMDLLPEVSMLMESLQAASDAVVRALDFLQVRNEVAMEKFGKEVDDNT